MPDENAIRLRDALVSHWVLANKGAARQAYVLNAKATGDLALFAAPRRMVILLIPLDPIPEWGTISTIEHRIRSLLAPAEGLFLAGTRHVIHVVFLGGDTRVRSWVQQVQFQSASLERAVAFHHVTLEEGKLDVWHASGAPAWLDEALKQTPDLMAKVTSPLTPSQLAATLIDAQRVVAENRAWGEVMRRPARMTKWLMGAIVAVFLLQLFWSRGAPGGTAILWLMGACSRQLVEGGDYWRLLATAFLHAGYLHLLLNLSVLYQLGPFLERILGPRRFLILYGVSALGGSAAIVFLSPHSVAVGASTALCGLIAALAVLAWRNGDLFASNMVPRLRRDLLINLVLIVAISLIPGISLAGHFGGMVAGALLVGSGLLVRGVSPVRNLKPVAPGDQNPLGSDVALVDGSAGVTHSPLRPHASGLSSEFLTLTAALVGLAMVGSVVMGILQDRPWILRDRPVLERVSAGHLPFSIALPKQLHAIVTEPASNPASVTFGDFGHTPLVVEIVANIDNGAFTGDGAVAFLKAYLAAAQLENVEVRDGPDGHPVVLGSKAYGESVRLTVSVTLNSGFLVTTTVLNFSGLPRAWEALAHEIPVTLQFDPHAQAAGTDIGPNTSVRELNAIALTALAEGRVHLARKALKRLVKSTPQDADAWLRLATVSALDGRFEEAVAAYQKSLALNPGDSSAYGGLGEAFLKLGRLDDALAAFRKQTEIAPDGAKGWVNLARAQLDQNSWSDAQASLKKAEDLGAAGPFMDVLNGEVQLEAGKHEEALSLFRTVLGESPDPTWENNIAYILAEQNVALDWALEIAQDSVDKQRTSLATLTPETATWSSTMLTASLGHVWDTLGTVLLRRGDPDRAGPYLQSAWTLTRIGEVAMHLGELWEKKGDLETAAAWYHLTTTFPKEAKVAHKKLETFPKALRTAIPPSLEAAMAALPVRLGPFSVKDDGESPREPNENETKASSGTPATPAPSEKPDVARPALPADTPVYVVVVASGESTLRLPAENPKGVVVWGPSLKQIVPANGDKGISKRLRRILEEALPPVVFPNLEPLQLVIPARILCDSAAQTCEVLYPSPNDILAGWARDLPGDPPGQTLPTEAR